MQTYFKIKFVYATGREEYGNVQHPSQSVALASAKKQFDEYSKREGSKRVTKVKVVEISECVVGFVE